MLFNSLHFAIFFPIVTLLYFLLGKKARVPMLLAASCVFYMAFVPQYILILFVLILFDYMAGILIEKSTGRRRQFFLVASLCANIGMLGFFKYFNFFNANVSELAHWIGWNYSLGSLSIILPIGLSFHTFQSMSYTIEVYRGNFKAERSILHFALYVLFYPQLVAGPIERPQNLLHQFYEDHRFEWPRVWSGLKLMAVGLFKKIIIADRLAVLVNEVYKHPQDFNGLQLLVATYFFAIQIYCDFSGYTDIARGAARVMGVELMLNFNRPYLADSLVDFWRRWHISLSTWFRDYLYVPLGGNRVSTGRNYFNLAVVFLVSGLWHGANWTYVAWGAAHAVGFILCLATRDLRQKAAGAMGIRSSLFTRAVGVFVTFNFVCLTWVFFRASNITSAFQIIGRILSDCGHRAMVHPGLSGTEFATSVALILALLLVEMITRHPPPWFVAAA
ncbi:MAG: MBOAT family protein, partial [Verrucomicrobiota bacterium]